MSWVVWIKIHDNVSGRAPVNDQTFLISQRRYSAKRATDIVAL
jgi:hypothetical protein